MTTLKLRRATGMDCRLLWQWANDPVVRAAAFNTSEIPWAEHERWFGARLRSAYSVIYIVDTPDDVSVGQVRFDRTHHASEVDVSLAAEWRGRGLAGDALRLACDAFQSGVDVPIIARIRAGNVASQRAFERAGFTYAGQEQVAGHAAVRLVRAARVRPATEAPGCYVVAAAGERYRAVFERRLARQPGEWMLVTSPDELTAERLDHSRPRYVFFLHWSWRVPVRIVDAYECIGFHMSDLPYGRGGSPLQNLILRGQRTTVLTAFRLVDDIDAGPVYLKAPLSLEGRAEEIYTRAALLAADLIAGILVMPPTPVPQSGEVVEFRRRTPDESRVPETATPEQLYDFIRMLDADGYPRAFVQAGAWRCELSEATLHGGIVRAQALLSRAPQ